MAVFTPERGRVLHSVHQQLAAGQVGHLERLPLQTGIRPLPRGHFPRAQGKTGARLAPHHARPAHTQIRAAHTGTHKKSQSHKLKIKKLS